MGFRSLLLIPLLAVTCVTHAQTHREARGWLRLERDQATYRERVAPLDLSERRQLDTVEREQRNDLRAVQQRQSREERQRLRERSRPLRTYDEVPRRDPFLQKRQALERERLEIQRQQQGLPFGHRPAPPPRARPTPMVR